MWVIPLKRQRFFNILESEKDAWHCNVCTYTYLIFDKKTAISKCPRCGSFNRRVESSTSNSNFSLEKIS